MTEDRNGRSTFCLTLQTREQHIRRAKATSNICSNEALSALNAVVYLSMLGKQGIRRLGELLISRTRELARAVGGIDGFKAPFFHGYHFNEFVVKTDMLAKTVYKEALRNEVIPGFKLKEHFPELGDSLLLSVTEMTSDEDFNKLLDAFEYIGGQ
jgi:glycine dehydrogenase subunit 1